MKGILKAVLMIVLLAAGLFGLSPGRANADLIGASVHATFRLPDFATVFSDGGTQTIAAGTVFDFSSCCSLTVSFSASQITITNTTSGPFNVPGTFEGLDLVFLSGPAITGVTEDAASTPIFATGSVVNFSANDINLN